MRTLCWPLRGSSLDVEPEDPIVARVVTFDQRERADAEAALQWMQARAVPAARELEGFRAATALVDQERGRIMAITFFESLEHLEAAIPSFEETALTMPKAFRESVSASVLSTEALQVALTEGLCPLRS